MTPGASSSHKYFCFANVWSKLFFLAAGLAVSALAERVTVPSMLVYLLSDWLSWLFIVAYKIKNSTPLGVLDTVGILYESSFLWETYKVTFIYNKPSLLCVGYLSEAASLLRYWPGVQHSYFLKKRVKLWVLL
jgi:hypothetical protein